MELGIVETSSTLMTDFLQKCGGYAVVDGGFATELERHGADLNDPLWSAKCLFSSPHLVRKVHLDYLHAGASIIITASYQATIQGFVAKGLSEEEAELLLRRSVEIACEAREIYFDKCTEGSLDYIESGNISRRPVLVAASIGSYGAYLADGSEYSGKYGDAVTLKTLKDFHRRRLQILAKSGADLIAFETIPNKLEAKAYAELLEEEETNIPAWFSFNSKDGINVVSGDSILECASIADSCKRAVAVGINCTPPRFIHGLVLAIQKATSKPIVIYPNSGETYNAGLKQWTVHLDYLHAGASIIITASYQATIQGFVAKGLSEEEAELLLRRSVEIACEAREIYFDKCTKGSLDYIESGNISRRPVLVAASIGSYGAYLADGSEYSGKYGDAVTLKTLKDFHRRRLQILAKSGADLIAFETIPNKLEAKAYAELLEEEETNIPAWFSFNSKDGINVVSGDSILECASIADSCKRAVAVGINCTPPRFIHGLVLAIQNATSKPIVIYPNSGETYNAGLKQWTKSSGAVVDEDFVSYIGKWREAGASLFGGCCRTTPNTIRAISRVLSKCP